MPNVLTLYGMDFSPMVRSCKLLLKLLDIKYDYQIVNLFAHEQHSLDFVKRNPLKLVPVLEDNGQYIADSTAICCYLVDKYCKDDILYPKDLIQRAQVNQCLFFNASLIFMSVRNIAGPVFGHMTSVVSREKLDNLIHACELLEALLERHEFMSGNNWTLADLLTAPIVMIGRAFVRIDQECFPCIHLWLKRISKQVPYFNETHISVTREYLLKLKSMITEVQY